MATNLFKGLKTACLKMRREQLDKLGDLIEEWRDKRRQFSSAYVDSERERVRQINYGICCESVNSYVDKRERLENHPLNAFDLSQSIELTIFNTDSTLHLYSEHKLEKERQLQKRIVGGCGVALDNQPIQIDPMGHLLLDQQFEKLWHLFNEEVLKISHEGEQGAVFKLSFIDFPILDAKARRLALDYFSPSKADVDPAIEGLYEAIETGDESLFERWVEDVRAWDFQDSQGRSLLHVAASRGHLGIVKRLSEKCSLLSQEGQGWTALHEAAAQGHVEVIHFLLSKEFRLLNRKGIGGETALYVAAEQGREEVVCALLEKGADPNAQTAHGMNALMCAIYRELPSICLQLLKNHRIDLKATLDDHTNALHLAVQSSGMKEVIEALIRRKLDVNQARWDGYVPLHLAAKKGDLDVLRILVKAPGINLNAQLKSGKTALHLAAENDDHQTVELLLENKADPLLFGWDRETTLITAVRTGSELVVLTLLDHVKTHTVMVDGQRIPFLDVKDMSGRTALEIGAHLRLSQEVWFSLFDAIKEKATQTALGRMGTRLFDYMRKSGDEVALEPMRRLLLFCHLGVDFDFIDAYIKKHALDQPERLLEVATTCAKNGHTMAVTLLSRRVNLDKWRDSNGWGVHHYMAKFDHMNFFSPLLENSARFSPQEIQSWGYIAARCGSLRSLKLLFEVLHKRKSFDLLVAKKCLLEAVQGGQREVVDWLTNAQIDPKLSLEVGGKCAAHFAAMSGNLAMVELLLERGALFSQLDGNGLSPLHDAVLYNHEQVLTLLLNPVKRVEIPKDLLHFAVAKGSPKIIEVLLQVLSDPNLLDPVSQETPLFSAVRENRLENVTLLCQLGASLEVRNRLGETPFLLSAKHNGLALPLLLQYCPSDQVNPEGENALHLAAMRGSEEDVAFLLKQGLNPEIRDGSGKTALMHAEERGFLDVSALLEGKQAELEEEKEALIHSLEVGDLDGFFKRLQRVPVDRAVSFTLPRVGRISLPLLHLIDSLVSEETKKKEILKEWAKRYPETVSVRTKEGWTLLHLVAIQDKDPPLQNMDPFAADLRGITPLHLFARSESLSRFESIYSGIDWEARDQRNGVDVEDLKGHTPLFYAIEKKRGDHVAFLLDKGANPNHVSKALLTPLGLAIEKESLPIVRSLIEKGGRIFDRIGADGETALHLAVRKGAMEIVRHLIESRVDLFQKDYRGREAIHIAAAQGDEHLVRLLGACGASLFSLDAQGNGIAFFAVQSGSLRLLDFLKEHGVPLDPSERSESAPAKAPLHVATGLGNLSMIAQFARHKANFEVRDARDNTALFYATLSRNPNVLDLFSASPLMDEKEQVSRSILAAIQLDCIPQVRLLQRELTSINQPFELFEGMTLLHAACRFGAVRTAHYLLEQGADPLLTLYNGTSCFELAVSYDQVEIARAIASQIPIDLNQKRAQGKHFIHLAAEKGSDPMLAFLFLEGADLNALDSFGNTPLHLAAQKGHVSTLKLLLVLGATPIVRNFEEQTMLEMIEKEEMRECALRYEKTVAQSQELQEGSLHRAVRLEEAGVLAVLAQVDDLHQRNKEGRTPLHLAAAESNVSFLRRLLELEIDPDLDLQDDRGKTPLAIPRTEGKDPQVALFLENLGARVADVETTDEEEWSEEEDQEERIQCSLS